jgi:orotate phosphoribosyltransferase-like protein
MSSLDDLVGRAKMLLAEGHSPGQIADELSLSMETVTWLLTQGKGYCGPKRCTYRLDCCQQQCHIARRNLADAPSEVLRGAGW